MDINDWQTAVHSLSTDKGWWEDCPEPQDAMYPYYLTAKTALIACEAAEAIEEVRSGSPHMYYQDDKPEGIAVELVDVIIRSLDMLAHLGVDADHVMQIKHEYNTGRAYRHGGKKL